MSKYDFELDLSQNSSTGMILQRIKKGSVVLEFGCATGRMTRYMQQELGCRVYIVEYEDSAFQKAMQYAQDGLCDDIMAFRWREKFAGVKFDAILFADVLEHLSAPEKVLQSAAELLKDDGAIHISVPNITHNDILIKAWSERFDYTKTGLLDDTHVHFWGLENLKQLAQQSGLFLQSVEGTYCRTGETEQQPQLGDRSALLENVLRLRRCGEVYQFVVSLTKNAQTEPVYRFKQPTLRMHLYLDTGNNFNQNEVLSFEAEYDGAGGYCAHYALPEGHGASRIRLDPVEHQGCILTQISVRQNGNDLPLGFSEGIGLNGGMCLYGNDPMVYADVQPEAFSVELRIVLPGPEFERILEENSCLQRDRIHALTADMQAQQIQAAAREQTLKRTITGWEGQFAAAKKEIGQLSKEMDQLRTDVCSYIILSNNKEKRILEQEQKIRILEQMVHYRNTLPGLLRGLAAWTLRKLKACAKWILGRRNTNG